MQGQDAKIRPLEIFRYSKLLNLMVYHTHSKDTHSYEKIPYRHWECAVKKNSKPSFKRELLVINYLVPAMMVFIN